MFNDANKKVIRNCNFDLGLRMCLQIKPNKAVIDLYVLF